MPQTALRRFLPPALSLVNPGLAMAASNGRLSSLRQLAVSYCPGVGDNGLRAALDGCLSLRELLAGGCAEVSPFHPCYAEPDPDAAPP